MTLALDYSHLVRPLLSSIQSVDACVYRLLNGLTGNRFLDYIAKFAEGDTLFKGGAFLGLYWYFWFRPGSDRERRKGAILAILIGAILSIGLSRTIADLAPFRVRPMYNPLLPHHAYAFSISPRLVDWSAFPSDTATFFFTLAFGLKYLSRRIAALAMFYTATWICLPRIFLGVHYASDICAGAIVGILAVMTCFRLRWFESNLVRRVVRIADGKPEVFYPLAFLASLEMAVLFDDVRAAGSMVYRMLQVDFHLFVYTASVVAAIVAVAAAAVWRFFQARRESEKILVDVTVTHGSACDPGHP